jgi:hypothetical protein
MPNKFQKSVSERLDAEEKRRKTVSDPEAAQPEQEEATDQEPEKDNPQTIAPLSEEKIASALSPDIRAYLIHDTHRVAKNKTFYLDAAVIDAIKRISREQQVTESRLVNDILRGIFGL